MISGHQEFFSTNLVGRICFPFFSHKLSITFVLHAIFFHGFTTRPRGLYSLSPVYCKKILLKTDVIIAVNILSKKPEGKVSARLDYHN